MSCHDSNCYRIIYYRIGQWQCHCRSLTYQNHRHDIKKLSMTTRRTTLRGKVVKRRTQNRHRACRRQGWLHSQVTQCKPEKVKQTRKNECAEIREEAKLATNVQCRQTRGSSDLKMSSPSKGEWTTPLTPLPTLLSKTNLQTPCPLTCTRIHMGPTGPAQP